MEESQLIPFYPKPNDVISRDYHDLSLKCVKLSTRRNVAYNRLLRNCWPQLKQGVSKPVLDRMASEIVDTIVRVQKGRFIRLVSAGPDNKGLCKVLSPFACHEKVLLALQRMQKRLMINPSGKRRPAPSNAGKGKAKHPGSMEGSDVGESSSSDEEEESGPDSEEELEQNEVTVPTTAVMKSPGQKTIIPFDPKPNDVIATNDKRWQSKHPGNIVYRDLLQKYFPQFLQQNETMLLKAHSTVSEMIVDKIFQNKGRFLKWQCAELPDPGFCIVMSRSDSVCKVQKALYLIRTRKGSVASHELDRNREPASLAAKSSSKLSASKSTYSTLPVIPKSTPKLGDSKLKAIPKSAQKSQWIPEVKAKAHKHIGNSAVSTPSNAEPWTVERLYQNPSAHSDHLYGSPQDEMAMRKWLDQNKLPQSVAEYLLGFGARTIDDVMLMVEVKGDDLKALPTLDLHKLTRAVQSRRDEEEDDAIHYV